MISIDVLNCGGKLFSLTSIVRGLEIVTGCDNNACDVRPELFTTMEWIGITNILGGVFLVVQFAR
jgi:hypothetical protein